MVVLFTLQHKQTRQLRQVVSSDFEAALEFLQWKSEDVFILSEIERVAFEFSAHTNSDIPLTIGEQYDVTRGYGSSSLTAGNDNLTEGENK